MSKTICLSAGHGAGDPGVINRNLKEADLTIRIATRAAEIIRKHGVNCLYVPDNLTLVQTINWINERASQITIAVDVHINSGGGKGVEGWNYQGGPNESDKLSQFLADACAAETRLPNRGIKDESQNRYKKLGFIHDTKPIAALIECGFIDGDYDYLNTAAGLEQLARGVARGSLGYIGVAWNPSLLNPTAPTRPQPVKDDSDTDYFEGLNLTDKQSMRDIITGYKNRGREIEVLKEENNKLRSAPLKSYAAEKAEIQKVLDRIP